MMDWKATRCSPLSDCWIEKVLFPRICGLLCCAIQWPIHPAKPSGDMMMPFSPSR